MGVVINIEGNEIKNSEIGNRMKIDGDAEINIKNNKSKYLKVLNDVEINSLLDDIKQSMHGIDDNSIEYRELIKIIEDSKKKGKNVLIKEIVKHVGTFTSGVLQSVLAGYIEKNI